MKHWLAVVSVCVTFILIGGCGGGGSSVPQPSPGDNPSTVQVGPLVVQPAATASFQVRDIPSDGLASFVAMYGSRINYIAVRELLDRIVFSSFRTPSNWDIWVCDLFGDNLHRVAGTSHPDRHPAWSPDGRTIAFAQERETTGQADIMTVSDEGGTLTNLTNSTHYDTHPTWSPTGGRIAFESDRAGNWEIHSMYANGTSVVNLTNNAEVDVDPDWCRERSAGGIAFTSSRGGGTDIYYMAHDGAAPTAVTSVAGSASNPTWLDAYTIAFSVFDPGAGTDIRETTVYAMDRGALADSHHYEDDPCYSTDGRYLAYTSAEGGGFNIWLRELAPPYRRFRVTDGAGSDAYPDLGSPTLQTARVLIGPAGSDHGYNPIWGHAVAGIAVFSHQGYMNFIRPAIQDADAASIRVTPLDSSGGLVGVELRANEILNLREDAGIGQSPTLWEFNPRPAAVVIYLHSYTGKIVSVLLPSETRPSSMQTATAQAQGDGAVIDGSFSHVFDSTGALVAEGEIGRVVIDARGSVTAAF